MAAMTQADIIARTKVDKVRGCWLWTGSLNGAGYGNLGRNEGGMAHQVAYRLWVGEIPEKAQIHHRCQVKSCVNPEHLVAVTRGVNQWISRAERRGNMGWEHLRSARLLHSMVGKRGAR